MRFIKKILWLSVGFLLFACNLPTMITSPTPLPPPTGRFSCYGTRNGFYAAAGDLVLHPDGTLEFNGEGGKWSYDAETRAFTFTENKYLASGTYSPENNSVSLTLKPDAVLSHAETGGLGCQPYAKAP